CLPRGADDFVDRRRIKGTCALLGKVLLRSVDRDGDFTQQCFGIGGWHDGGEHRRNAVVQAHADRLEAWELSLEWSRSPAWKTPGKSSPTAANFSAAARRTNSLTEMP